ncbi:MAG: hypothetical protein L3K26_06870, partial [Candidatus Hydrogenedentes bacterium]|nr:hypothetical protein [Candidatus Hydrogenedentota bacterium]
VAGMPATPTYQASNDYIVGAFKSWRCAFTIFSGCNNKGGWAFPPRRVCDQPDTGCTLGVEAGVGL